MPSLPHSSCWPAGHRRAVPSCAEPCRAVIPSSCAGPRRLTGLRDPLPAKLLRCQPRVSRENAKQPASRPSHPPQPSSSSSSAADSLPPSRWSREPPGRSSRVPPNTRCAFIPAVPLGPPHRCSQGVPPMPAPPPGAHVPLLWVCLERDDPPSPNFPALCRAGTIVAFVFP